MIGLRLADGRRFFLGFAFGFPFLDELDFFTAVSPSEIVRPENGDARVLLQTAHPRRRPRGPRPERRTARFGTDEHALQPLTASRERPDLGCRPSPRCTASPSASTPSASFAEHEITPRQLPPPSVTGRALVGRAAARPARPAPHQQRWRDHPRPASARSRGVHRRRARPAPRSSAAGITPASSVRESAARSGPGPGTRRIAARPGRPRLTPRASGSLLGPPAGTRR